MLIHDEKPAPEKGEYCVKYHSKTEDKNPLLREQARDKTLIPEMHGYTCRHPDNSTIAVDWQYSRRAARTRVDPALETTAESFLDGLEYNNPHSIKDL